MNAKRLAHFRALLEGERDRLRALLERAGGVGADIAAGAPGEESEPGVGGATIVDDTALIALESAALADVERALQLIRDDPGEYGVCRECGVPIGDARLELLPTARMCARHAAAHPVIP